MANYINPHTGATIGYLETSGTTVEPFQVPMMWQASTLSYVTLLSDASGNLLTSGGGGGGGNPAAGLTGNAVPTYGDYIAFSGAGGLLTGVSATNPLPCTFTGSAGNAAAGLTGAAVPGSADYSGWNNGGNLVGTSLASALPVQPGTGATFPVSGTFWQATQPVSIAAAVTVSQPTAANLNATVTGTVAATQSGVWSTGRTWTLASGTDSVTTVPSGTQTVSGTVAATQSGTWNIGSITTLPSITGSVSVSNFPATQPVSGAVSISGTVPVTGSLTTTPNPLPTVVVEDPDQYDDDGYRYVNPNVPGADIATGDRQQQQINLAASTIGTPGAIPTAAQAIGGVYYGTQPTYASGAFVPMQMDNNGSVLVNINDVGAPVPVTPSLAPNSAQETAGQLQRIADLMEAILAEVRTHTILMANLNQPIQEDPDKLRQDINLTLQ